MGLWKKWNDAHKQAVADLKAREAARAEANGGALPEHQRGVIADFKLQMSEARQAEQLRQGITPTKKVERKVMNLIIQDKRDQKKYEAMLAEGWRLEFDPIKRAGLRGATYSFIREW